jgi:murein DD-endopeptidase MepM/ murein hydrolase activator NlpD
MVVIMTAHNYVMVTDQLTGVIGDHGERIDWQDLNKSFKVNMQVSTAYEISFTLTYTKQYAAVYNLAQEKREVLYNDEYYVIQQIESLNDENGMATLQVTANHWTIDAMKSIRIDTTPPTESNPETSGGSSSDTGDSGDPQPGVVVKRTDEQQTYTLQNRLDHFFSGNSAGLKYELHGDFPQAAVECTGSLYEWLGNNLKLFGGYWVPRYNVIEVYDLAHFKKPTGKTLYYLHDMTGVDIQSDANDLVNDCWVYGGKMEKDITSVLGAGGQTNGVTEPVNGDWTPVMQNAASLVGEKLSSGDIANIKNRIRVESGGRETVVNNWDSNAAAGHPSKGLLQFIDNTFNYYCRPPYTNIMKGLDQLIAMMNIPNWRQQIAGNSGWSPHGAPISKATITIQQSDNSWGWPFPSGEGHFMQAQLFGYDGGYRQNSFHDGLDFGSIDHPGSQVHAIHGGRCTISRAWGNGGINWYCVIQDSSGLNVEYQEAFGSAGNITVNVGDVVKTGDVIGYRTTNHLHVGITRASIPGAFAHAFSNDGTWLDPLAAIKNGTAGGSTPTDSSGDTTTSTTSEVYYSLVYHFEDQDSIKKYGRHRGQILTVDSIYDMDALKTYTWNTVQHDPNTTLTISGYRGDAELGQVVHLIVPERRLDTDVTLVGYEGNDDYFDPNGEKTVTFNNTGLALKDVNEAIRQDIKDINTSASSLDYYGALGARQEDHWANLRFSPNQVKSMSDMMKGVNSSGGSNNSKQ